MADAKKQTLDIQALLASEMGPDARIKEVLPSGAAKIVLPDPDTGEEIERELDIPALMRDEKLNPAEINIKWNDENSPLPQNALSFTDKLKMNWAGTAKQQAEMLSKEFGAENVKADPENPESFIVRDAKGVWKKADTDLLSGVVGDIPETVGGLGGTIAGAKAGALAGAFLGPAGVAAGAAIGAVAGGGIGTAMAKLGEIKAAEALGIRTEEDVDSLASELGKEAATDMFWSTVIPAGGKLVSKIANKEALANLFSSLIKGTKVEDWAVAMRNSETARHIKKAIDTEVAWVSKNFGEVKEELSPLTKRMNMTMVGALEDFSRSANANYERGMKKLVDADALNPAKLDATGIFNSYGKQLVDLGVAKVEGDSFKILPAEVRRLGKDLTGTPEAANQLITMFAKLENTVKTQGGKFKDFENFVDIHRTMNAIRKAAGAYGTDQKSDVVAGAMRRLGGEMTNLAQRSLNAAGKIKLDDGTTAAAGDFFKKISKDYHVFEFHHDNLGNPIRAMESTSDMLKLAQNLASEKKMDLAQSFLEMGRASGSKNASMYLDDLMKWRSAKNLSSAYTGEGLISSGMQLAQITPQNLARTATGIIGAPAAIAEYGQAAASWASKKAPLPAAAVNRAVSTLMPVAKAVDFVRNLSPTETAKLLTDKQLLDSLLTPVYQSMETRQTAEDALMSMVPNGQR